MKTDDLINRDNLLLKATDPCTDPTFTNALHFADGADQPEEYTYDANGNMTADLNKHIRKISYNTQNLPQEVRFDDGSSIAYLYDADGNKLRTSYAIASYSESMPVTQVMHGNVSSQAQQPYMARNSIDYCGSAVYENGKLAYVPIDVGYITFADSTATSAPTFHYYVKDYLGNNRLVVRDDGFGEQMNHYYPFGALMAESTQGETQRYKYNGKELDRIHGLNLYDYGARLYDSALGRWTSVDPLAEKHPESTPYAYCDNNPIRFLDPDGKEKLEIFLYSLSLDGKVYSEYKAYWDNPDVINLWGHGIVDGSGKYLGLQFEQYSEPTMNPQDYYDFFLHRSKLWKEHVRSAKVVSIVLHSCYSAQLAAILSESPLFKDVIIIGAETAVDVFTNKDEGSIYDKPKDVYVSSKLANNGRWNYYKNGKLIERKDGNYKPGQNVFEWPFKEPPLFKGFFMKDKEMKKELRKKMFGL